MRSLRLQVILVTGKVFPPPQITLHPKRARSLSAPLASLGTPAASLMFPGKEGTSKKSGKLSWQGNTGTRSNTSPLGLASCSEHLP